MRKTRRRAVLPTLAALALGVSCARADAFAGDRFHGGSHDGYDSVSFYRDEFLVSLVRFRGGSFDGYTALSASGLKVPLRGTIMSIR